MTQQIMRGTEFASRWLGHTLGRPWLAAVIIVLAAAHPGCALADLAGAPAIHVQGNQFVDASGAPVQLRGVNISGLESVAVQGWSVADPWGGWKPVWSVLRTWRVNAIRLPLNESSWLHYPCVDEKGQPRDADPGKNYQATVRKTVADAVEQGFYVILDLHWTAPGTHCSMGQNAMADADHSIDFWASIADAFKDNPAVLFELFNEPFLPDAKFSWDEWRNGAGETVITTPVAVSYTWQSAGMQNLLDTVRGTGAKNVVLVGGMHYSNDLTGWSANRPTDPAKQLGAAWHVYGDTTYRDVDAGGSTHAMLAAVAADVPIAITEVGDAVGLHATGKFVATILNFADRNGYSYLGWTWNYWGQAENDLTLDASGTPTPGFGVYFKQHLICRAEKGRCK